MSPTNRRAFSSQAQRGAFGTGVLQRWRDAELQGVDPV